MMRPSNQSLTHLLTLAVVVAATFGSVSTSYAQLITSWTAPTVDDGNPVANPVNSWLTNVAAGSTSDLPEVAGARALAADNATGRLYAASGSSLTTYAVDDNGIPTRIGDACSHPRAAGRRHADAIGSGSSHGLCARCHLRVH